MIRTPNDIAPDFAIPDINGSTVSLHETLRENQTTLLIFLRHLGWLPCREHVAQLCQRADEIQALNTRVLIITFGTLPAAQSWINETCSTFRVLLDDKRVAYRAYKLERSYLRSWGLKPMLRYAQLLSNGRKWRGIQGDSAQLGGDFIVDSNGVTRFAYRSHDPTDRSSAEDIINYLEKYQS